MPLCLVQLLLPAFIVKYRVVLIRWQNFDHREGGVRVSLCSANGLSTYRLVPGWHKTTVTFTCVQCGIKLVLCVRNLECKCFAAKKRNKPE